MFKPAILVLFCYLFNDNLRVRGGRGGSFYRELLRRPSPEWSRSFKKCFPSEPISRNKELASLEYWGPEYKVSFDLTIKSYPTSSDWAGILRLTTGGDCCDIGDRIPLFKLFRDNQLVILNAVNDQGNHQSRFNLNTNQEYAIELSQTKESDNQFHYRIMIDGEERLNIVNNKPRTFTNVKVSSIDNWINPADAEYNNLCIENFGEDKQNLGCPQRLIDAGWEPEGILCYKFFDEKKTWEEAQKSCRKQDTVLATVKDQELNNFVTSLAGGARFWIGGKRSCDGCQDWKWTQHFSQNAQNWAAGEPNNYGGNEDCVEVGNPLFDDNMWNDQKCGEKIGYVCQTYLFI